MALALNFFWLWPNEVPSPAPGASIIEYAQYPEVRFSGFLSQSPHSPRALRREEQQGFGQRALILGHAGEKVLGAVVTEASEPGVIAALAELPEWPLQPLLRAVKTGASKNAIDPESLLSELKGVAGTVHQPQVLRRIGEPVEYVSGGKQAGGWTLEALLGVPRNAKAAPDKYGFEIKAVGGNRTSLITTEPDFGYRAEKGVPAYLQRFGREARAGGGKLVFSGVHRCGKPNAQTGAHLTIDNWDFETNTPTGTGQPNIVLLETKTDTVISGWSFAKIGQSWTKKHAGAVFVETTQLKDHHGAVTGYRYGPISYWGLGTSALRFLGQVGSGVVILDPGDSQTPGSTHHARTQWRVEGAIGSLLPERLRPLYDSLSLKPLFS